MHFSIFIYLFLLQFPSLFCTPINGELSPFGECFDGFSCTFLRHIGTRHIDGPAFIAKIDMVTCAAHCKSNFDPSSEESFPCEGFNFRAGRNPICEFFPATGSNKNATRSLKVEQVPTYYYEKICLKIARRCEESAYLFDSKQGFRIDEIPIQIINVTNEKECMEECIRVQCVSFGFHHDAKRCSFYNTTRRDATVIRDAKMDYYENNCIHPSSRCPNGRIEFYVTRNADVPSFGLSLGVKSIRSCMQSCINTPQFFCRSIQFDAMSNQCFVSDETSDVAVPSSSLDIFEPFCVQRNDENTCNRPYSFEKTITSKFRNPKIIRNFPDHSSEKCLQKCIDSVDCKSINYNVLTKNCTILSNSKIDSSIENDENFDFYEMTCPKSVYSTRIPEITKTSELESDYKLVERSHELLERYRAKNYSDVENVQECWKLCLYSENCQIVAFSPILSSCVLSNDRVFLPFNIQKLIQPSDTFDIYTSSNSIIDRSLSTRPTTQPTTTALMKSTTIQSDQSNQIFEFTEDFMNATTPINRVRAHSLPNTELLKEPIKSTFSVPIDPELVGLEDRTPQLFPESSGISHVNPQLLSVSADCLPKGINITFDLPPTTKYTGAVYASERFEQCRIFLKNSSSFSIFIPRPKHNSWCNAIEFVRHTTECHTIQGNNEMSTIVIVSNDRILPHDLTTKNDLFYQISCQYNENDETRISKGIVVGGPSPVLIEKKNEIEEKVSLEITREGRIVESVFVGESLVATVKSKFAAESLRIVDCTAHRVGGNGPPATVNLIADGCALLPSIMSPMRLTAAGWQSSLSAFRIDGSEQIDVVCIINICSERKCPELACPSPQRSVRSVVDEENSIRVDRRLMVKGERNYGRNRSTFSQICIEPSLYLPGLAIFFLSLISIAVSMFMTFRKTMKNDAQVEELLNTSIPHEMGPKYVKTDSM